MRNAEFYYSAGKSFAEKLNVFKDSKAAGDKVIVEVLEAAIEDRKKKIPAEFLEAFNQGLLAE